MSNHTIGPNLLPINDFEEICRIARQISAIYLWILFAIGVPGNVLTILTTLSMQTLSPATFFVALLAFFDGSALVVKLIYNQLVLNAVPLGKGGCKMEFLPMYLATVANWMLVLICAERFISVCYPLKKISVFTKRRSYICAATVAGVFLLLYGILFVIMRAAHRHGECGTMTYFAPFWKTIWYWINIVAFLFIPFLLILTFTGGIIRGLYLSHRDRRILLQKGSGRDSRNEAATRSNQRLVAETERAEMAITFMMILVAALFLVFTIPGCLFQIMSDPRVRGICDTKSDAYWAVFEQVQFLLVDATHALNFFMYFFAARRFRSQLFKLLRCKTCKVRHHQTTSSQLRCIAKVNVKVCLQQNS